MSYIAAEREWDRSKTRAWTGDVWKMLPILQEFRPDLKITILDVAPTGIVKIEKLEPRSKVLEKNYQQIIKKFVFLSLDDYGLDKFVNSINLKPIGIPATVAKKNRWENPATPNPSMLRIAIKAPKARPEKINKIVDYAFARGVADALLRKGHSVRIDSGADWYSDAKGTDFDLAIRGRGGFEPQSNIPMISWIIYPGKTKKHLVSQNEVESSEHTFFASSLDLEAFKKRGLGDKCSLLMQGFDKKIMYPKTKSHKDQSDIALVGSNHFATELRPIVAMALEAKAKLRIFGRGWKNTIASGFLESSYIDNAKVGDLYRSSKIVLCDHLESMRKGGYVSNRIFDVLACGTPIISDDIQGLPDDIRGFVKTVSSSHEFAEAVAEIGAESAQQKNKRQIMAKKMLDHHSFDQRADQISKTLIGLKQKKEQASG